MYCIWRIYGCIWSVWYLIQYLEFFMMYSAQLIQLLSNFFEDSNDSLCKSDNVLKFIPIVGARKARTQKRIPQLSSLVSLPQNFKRTSRLANSFHFTVEIALCNRNFYSTSFFSRNSCLRNSLPRSCFPGTSDCYKFKRNINQYLLPSSVP